MPPAAEIEIIVLYFRYCASHGGEVLRFHRVDERDSPLAPSSRPSTANSAGCGEETWHECDVRRMILSTSQSVAEESATSNGTWTSAEMARHDPEGARLARRWTIRQPPRYQVASSRWLESSTRVSKSRVRINLDIFSSPCSGLGSGRLGKAQISHLAAMRRTWVLEPQRHLDLGNATVNAVALVPPCS